MIIQAPLSSKDEIDSLINAGADEFYCGIVPLEWKEKYGFEIPLNCRSTYTWANFDTVEELACAVEIAHGYGKQVMITLNETSYSEIQIKLIIDLLDKLSEIRVDGVIVSDLALLLTIKNMGYKFKISLSGEANCTSISAVDFYRDLGINRIVFPRNISIREMNEIIKSNNDLEYEAFFLNEGCFFSGGYCFGIHHVCYSPLCRTAQYKLKTVDKGKYSDELFKKSQIEGVIKYEAAMFIKYNRSWVSKCGLCSLKLLNQISVGYLKVVGRTGSQFEKAKWVQIAKKAVQMANEIDDYEKYRTECKNTFLGDDKYAICDKLLACYYPGEYLPEHILGEVK